LLFERLKLEFILFLLLLHRLLDLFVVIFLTSEELSHCVALFLDAVGLGENLVGVLPNRLSVLFNVIVLQLLVIADTLFDVVQLSLYL
jgi:hypothetical protein